mgnify:CR=1 FL=1
MPSKSSLDFKGTCHPPPARNGKRQNSADLNAAEIATASLGKNGATDVLVEHDARAGPVGVVTSSWEGRAGELRVSGRVTDPAAIQAIKTGSLRQLSLGTSVHTTEDGKVLMRTHDELSLCERAARPGCNIDDIDGRRVAHTATFSKSPGKNTHATHAKHKSKQIHHGRKQLEVYDV